MSLVTSKQMLEHAYQNRYAVGAFNFNNLESLQGIVRAAELEQSPLILMASKSALAYAGIDYIVGLAQIASSTSSIPICLHIDHANTFELCKTCIDQGFTSVMIDGSSLPFEENVALTKRVTAYAHDHGIPVEGELGRLAGVEDELHVHAADSSYTRPEEAAEFVAQTGVDSLAIAIGTSHGAFKFSGEARLRFDILNEVAALLPGFPIVLHGASCVMPEYVDIINRCGGDMAGAAGVPETMLQLACKTAVCKVNVNSDIHIGMTSAVRETLALQPKAFDPRVYLAPARDRITELVRHKMAHVFGSSHQVGQL